MNPLRRAKPLLGTLVSIEVADARDGARDLRAVEEAFAVIETIQSAMSAHSGDSDLSRLARAAPGARITVSRHTCAVLRAAQHWASASGRAFDPLRAGSHLAQRGARPGIATQAARCGSLAALEFEGDTTVVVDGPLPLDLGGIAKGYAVDQAVEVLRSHGVASALVNAGGDLRAFGDREWRIDLRHPSAASLRGRLVRLKDGAVATSVRGGEFVGRRRTVSRWTCASVQARDCMTADAFTKWALDAAEPGLQLRGALRRAGASLVRW